MAKVYASSEEYWDSLDLDAQYARLRKAWKQEAAELGPEDEEVEED